MKESPNERRTAQDTVAQSSGSPASSPAHPAPPASAINRWMQVLRNWILELDPRFLLAAFAVISLTLNNFGPLISKQLDRGSPSDFWGCFLFGLKTSEWFLVAFALVFGNWALAPRALTAISYPVFASLALIWGFEVFPGMPRGLAWILLVGGLICIACIAIALKVQARVFGWEFIRMKRTDETPARHSTEASSIGEEKPSAQNQIELRWFFLLMLIVATGLPFLQWGLAKTENSPSRFQWWPVLSWCCWFIFSLAMLASVLNAFFMRPRRWLPSGLYLLFFLTAPWLYLCVAQKLVKGSRFQFSVERSSLEIAYQIELGAITGISCILGIAWLSGYRLIKNQNSPPRLNPTGTLRSP